MTELPHARERETELVVVVRMVCGCIGGAGKELVGIVNATVHLVGEFNHPFQGLDPLRTVEHNGAGVVGDKLAGIAMQPLSESNRSATKVCPHHRDSEVVLLGDGPGGFSQFLPRGKRSFRIETGLGQNCLVVEVLAGIATTGG